MPGTGRYCSIRRTAGDPRRQRFDSFHFQVIFQVVSRLVAGAPRTSTTDTGPGLRHSSVVTVEACIPTCPQPGDLRDRPRMALRHRTRSRRSCPGRGSTAGTASSGCARSGSRGVHPRASGGHPRHHRVERRARQHSRRPPDRSPGAVSLREGDYRRTGSSLTSLVEAQRLAESPGVAGVEGGQDDQGERAEDVVVEDRVVLGGQDDGPHHHVEDGAGGGGDPHRRCRG